MYTRKRGNRKIFSFCQYLFLLKLTKFWFSRELFYLGSDSVCCFPVLISLVCAAVVLLSLLFLPFFCRVVYMTGRSSSLSQTYPVSP